MTADEPTPFDPAEIDALRRWHARSKVRPTTCKQGDPWPCRTARFLATFDSQSNPAKVAAFYAEWAARLDAARLEPGEGETEEDWSDKERRAWQP